MSIQVPLSDLAAAVDHFGGHGYLLTVTPESTVRAAGVQVVVADGLVRVGAGRSSTANVAINPTVTLLCAPVEEKGHTLLIDGTAALDEDGTTIVITPDSAVLHRPPFHADGPPAPALAAGWKPGGC